MGLLTPYSFEYVKGQLERATKVQIIQQLEDGKSCSVRSQGRSITTAIDTCPCGFVSAMQLPCKHIFAVRMSFSLPEYDESLCAERWKLQHFLSNIQNVVFALGDLYLLRIMPKLSEDCTECTPS